VAGAAKVVSDRVGLRESITRGCEPREKGRLEIHAEPLRAGAALESFAREPFQRIRITRHHRGLSNYYFSRRECRHFPAPSTDP
jgi:hypothetical protein